MEQQQKNKQFGALITKVMQKNNLNYNEAKSAFYTILNNETTEMQQGAFLAALNAKGETKEEVAGSWKAIYELDTNKVTFDSSDEIVDNCGTGMDSFKTFNISTAASLVAAAGGIKMARHGARAISSICGTVDIAEALGVDVECPVDIVANSINECNIGLFNGMSPQVHPLALGRILSQINFGSTLNIAASLANPALPKIGVRGVYNKAMINPVVEVMKEIGYKKAIILNGSIAENSLTIDEASVCGTTYCAELTENGNIKEFELKPEELGLSIHSCDELKPAANITDETHLFLKTLKCTGSKARIDAVLLNSGLIFYISGKAQNIKTGIMLAKELLVNGTVIKTLENWVSKQNREPEKGLIKLNKLLEQVK